MSGSHEDIISGSNADRSEHAAGSITQPYMGRSSRIHTTSSQMTCNAIRSESEQERRIKSQQAFRRRKKEREKAK